MVDTYEVLPIDQIIQGNCLEVLPRLPADSIDLIFADPNFQYLVFPPVQVPPNALLRETLPNDIELSGFSPTLGRPGKKDRGNLAASDKRQGKIPG